MHRVAPIVWTIALANALNAVLNWVFVYGHLGSPALGVAGSAIATAISRWADDRFCCSSSRGRILRPDLVPMRRDTLRSGRPLDECCGLACRSARSRRWRPARSRRSAC